MSRVRVHRPAALKRIRIRDLVSDEDQQLYSDAEMESTIRYHEPGGGEALQLLEIDYRPGADIVLHAHVEDEIIFVLAGTLHIGFQVVEAGSSVFVAGDTLYGFRAGPDGLRILNFRPRQDNSFITKDVYLARRAQSNESGASGSGASGKA